MAIAGHLQEEEPHSALVKCDIFIMNSVYGYYVQSSIVSHLDDCSAVW